MYTSPKLASLLLRSLSQRAYKCIFAEANTRVPLSESAWCGHALLRSGKAAMEKLAGQLPLGSTNIYLANWHVKLL
jgi:hypothetical protein